MKWISVEDQLPENDQEYLVFSGFTGDSLSYRPLILGKDFAIWKIFNITHWMPLPEPPMECNESNPAA